MRHPLDVKHPVWHVNGTTRELLEVIGYTTVDGDPIVRGVFADATGVRVLSVYVASLAIPDRNAS